MMTTQSITSTMRVLTVIVIVILAVSAVYVGLFIYIKNTNKEIAELTSTIDQQIQTEERLRSIENIVEDTAINRAKLDSYFVGQDDIVQFIEAVESLSGITGGEIEIASVDLEEGSNTSAYQFLHLRLTTKGAWEEVMYFTALLEALPNHVLVERGSLELRYTDEEVEEWHGSFDIKVAMLK